MAFNQQYPLWVSHSKIEAFSECPRKFYYRYVYRDPQTNNRITIINPPLALGQAVHGALEKMSRVRAEDRANFPLLEEFEKLWTKLKGKNGGFTDQEEEDEYKQRGIAMLKRVLNNPGPILNKSIRPTSLTKVKEFSETLASCWLSEEEFIVLDGKFDWLEYLPEDDSIHIIDFKTGKKEENDGSLQMPIYYLLAKGCQKRSIKKASYWYLQLYDELTSVELPDFSTALEIVLEPARKIKEAIENSNFLCIKGGCLGCEPYKLITNGEAEFVGISNTDGLMQDVYRISK